MIFDCNTALSDVWVKVTAEFTAAVSQADHPFRFMVLSTIDRNKPASRTVVLREFSIQTIRFFTDFRSQKINDIHSNPNISLLVYHPEKQLQVSIQGRAQVDHINEFSLKKWEGIPALSRKAYSSIAPPGAPIEQPSAAHLWSEKSANENFAVVSILPESADVLQLDGVQHLRAKFHKRDEWKGTWVAP